MAAIVAGEFNSLPQLHLFKGTSVSEFEVYMRDDQLNRAALVWNRGFGTLAIAKHLLVPEWFIYNNLEKIKILAKKNREKGN